MAQKTQIILVDDIDGSEATQSVTFALDGVTYEIDLNDDHAAVKARRVSGRRTRRRAGAPKTSSNTQKVREWARANGYEVSDRGRIPASVREAYEAAN